VPLRILTQSVLHSTLFIDRLNADKVEESTMLQAVPKISNTFYKTDLAVAAQLHRGICEDDHA